MFGVPTRDHFGGIRVVVMPDQPKMQLSEDVPVSPEMREDTNRWMLDFFGVTNAVKDGAYIHVPGANIVYMNPRTYDSLRRFAA